MENISTPTELESLISINYQRLQESRAKGEPVLEELFEKRMNEALTEYGDFVRFAVAANVVLGEN